MRNRKSNLVDKGNKLFDFNETEEIDIYYYIFGLEMSREQWNRMNGKYQYNFSSYSQWKEYIKKRYENYSVECLEEFYRYCNIRKCIRKSKKEYIDLLLPVFVSIVFTGAYTILIDKSLEWTNYGPSVSVI